MPTSPVSVVIPCFNAELFLGDALQSVMSQTLQPSEIIVVDDASTDRSVEIAKSFGPAVRVIQRTKNSGYCVVPKDIGLDEARHEFVAFLDADDLWTPGKLELQMPRFADPRVGLVYGRARTFATGQAPAGTAWPDEIPSGDVVTEFYFRCYAPNSSVVARRAALIEAGGFDRNLDFCEDFDLWLKTALRWRVEAVPDVVMLYRKHPGQTSQRRTVQSKAHRLIEERYADALKRATGISEEERRRRILTRLLGQMDSEFYNERDLAVARHYAEFIQQEFPDLDVATRRKVRQLHKRTFLPRVLYRLRDLLP